MSQGFTSVTDLQVGDMLSLSGEFNPDAAMLVLEIHHYARKQNGKPYMVVTYFMMKSHTKFPVTYDATQKIRMSRFSTDNHSSS